MDMPMLHVTGIMTHPYRLQGSSGFRFAWRPSELCQRGKRCVMYLSIAKLTRENHVKSIICHADL